MRSKGRLPGRRPMTTLRIRTNTDDPGLAAFVFCCICTASAPIWNNCDIDLASLPLASPTMICCAKQLGLKARAITLNWARLETTPLPGIAVLRGGGFLLLGKADNDKAFVQSPVSTRPRLMTQAEFEAMGRPARFDDPAGGLGDLSRRFDITWFPGAIHKYRRVARQGRRRLVFPPAVRAGFAVVFPGRDRQGAGAPQAVDARRAGDRAGHGVDVRNNP